MNRFPTREDRRMKSLPLALIALVLATPGYRIALADEPVASEESAAVLGDLPPVAETPVDFEQHIRPLLLAHCIHCHGADEAMSDLELDNKQRALVGGSRGQVIVPGRSADSLLVHFVAGLDPELTMPPDGDRLSDAEIGLLRAWIDQGAHWPDEVEERSPSTHWSFQPIIRPAIPPVGRVDWVRNPIDAFVLERLEQEGCFPQPRPVETRSFVEFISI